MTYGLINPRVGTPPITQHAAPAAVETIGTTAVTDVLIPLGTIVRATDPTYGEGEFIRLVGIGSTVVGDLVAYNISTYVTTLLTATGRKNLGTPVAVAMSACVAGEHGWYQISGMAVIKKTSVAVGPSVAIFSSGTAGKFKVVASAGQQIVGATTANAATVVTTTSTVIVAIDRPHTQSQIT